MDYRILFLNLPFHEKINFVYKHIGKSGLTHSKLIAQTKKVNSFFKQSLNSDYPIKVNRLSKSIGLTVR